MLKKLAVVAATAAVLAAMPATAAQADPKKGDTLTLNCDNRQSYSVVVFSSGTWSPGLVMGGNGVLRPVALDFTGTFTPAGGGPDVVFEEEFSKNIGSNTETTDCTFTESFTDDTGTFVIDGSVTVVVINP